jgi:RNA polymerase sigma-70 factor, ECF subfamily
MSDFGTLLEKEIPGLRRYARSLTRDAANADDLIQDCLLRALTRSHLWEAGTNLRAWLFTIMHNEHVNNLRRTWRAGFCVPLDDMAPMLAEPATQGAALQLRDLDRALACLPREQRQTLLLVGYENMRYEEAAEAQGVSIGTVRSRLHRGRQKLAQLMDRNHADTGPEAMAA